MKLLKTRPILDLLPESNFQFVHSTCEFLRGNLCSEGAKGQKVEERERERSRNAKSPLPSEWEGRGAPFPLTLQPIRPTINLPLFVRRHSADPQTERDRVAGRAADQSGMEEARNSPLMPSIYKISNRLIN